MVILPFLTTSPIYFSLGSLGEGIFFNWGVKGLTNMYFLTGDGRGDPCQDDYDGDGTPDDQDVCPLNSLIHRTDFRRFQQVALSPNEGYPVLPKWMVDQKVTTPVHAFTILGDPGVDRGAGGRLVRAGNGGRGGVGEYA